jgi:hypothetical protein
MRPRGGLVRRNLTRRDFLKVAGTGAAGTVLLGGSGCDSGTGKMEVDRTNVNKANVILVIIDSLRKDHVGAYGNDQAKTPNLDAIARDGLRFARAYPDAMPTIPARRAIHAGMRTFPFKDRPEQQRRAPVYGWLPIPEEQPTLAEILRGHGYLTMLITDTYHEFMPPMNFQRGFDTFREIRGQENDSLECVSKPCRRGGVASQVRTVFGRYCPISGVLVSVRAPQAAVLKCALSPTVTLLGRVTH